MFIAKTLKHQKDINVEKSFLFPVSLVYISISSSVCSWKSMPGIAYLATCAFAPHGILLYGRVIVYFTSFLLMAVMRLLASSIRKGPKLT